MNDQANTTHPSADQVRLLQKLFKQRQYRKTKSQAEALLERHPNSWLLWNFFAAAQGSLNEVASSILGFEKVIQLNPNSPHGFNNLGNMLHLSGRSEQALEKFQRAIELDGQFSPAYSNLGAVYKAQGKWDYAIENYRRAIDLNPKSAEAQNNLGRLLLLQQNFGEAFDLLEHRWNTQKIFGAPYDGTRPSWSGQETHRVLVWKEQGIGDEVMFGALIWDLWSQVAGVIVECDERLLNIYERSFPKEIRFVSSRTELSETEYDSQIAIGSLPKFFRRSRDCFKKTRTQWLLANDQGVARFRHTLKSDKTLIGISWSTASQKNNAGARNIKLSELIDGIGWEDHTFVNLQYGDVTEEIRQYNLSRGAKIIKQIPIDLFSDVNQLVDLVATCDVVVSIDNFTVHLAGALGITTHVLLPELPDERWGLIDQKSYWYQSVHLYRQISSGDWAHGLTQIRQWLKILKKNQGKTESINPPITSARLNINFEHFTQYLTHSVLHQKST